VQYENFGEPVNTPVSWTRISAREIALLKSLMNFFSVSRKMLNIAISTFFHVLLKRLGNKYEVILGKRRTILKWEVKG
jgi:hypothetical protein